MKATFENLSEKKRKRITDACVGEFGEKGFDSSSMDGVIKRAGISKGGLYEYVSSKKELFLFTVEYGYSELYAYLRKRLSEDDRELTGDLIDRLHHIAELAIDFYLIHPEIIALIVRTSSFAANETIASEVSSIFEKHFYELFGDTDTSMLRYPKEKVLQFSMWLLLKTRVDFLEEIKKETDPAIIKKDYLENWDFYLGVMRNGINFAWSRDSFNF